MKVVSKKTSYSFKEKYFQVEPEGRINRKQFIARWFLIFIIGMIVWTIIGYILPGVSIEDTIKIKIWIPISSPWLAIQLIIALCLYYVVYRINKNTYIKRYADFNNNGKSPRVLLPIAFYWYALISLFWLLVAYMGMNSLATWGTLLKTFMNICSLIIWIGGQFMIWAIFCTFIMFIISSFTSGTSGINTYGGNPEGNSII